MQVLELEPLKKKKLKLILVQSEFPIEWHLNPLEKEEHKFFPNLLFISKEYINFIEGLIEKYKPNFAAEEKGNRTLEEFNFDNPLIDVFKMHNTPYKAVDISDNASLYIDATLDNNRNLINELNSEIKKMLKENGKIEPQNIYLQHLFSWNEYLKEVYKEKENELRFQIREYWMMMGIFDIVKKQEKDDLTGLFICDKSHFDNMTNLGRELGITTEQVMIKKIAKNLEKAHSIKDILDKSVLEIMPFKVKKMDTSEKILYLFDTDDHASPFDINMGYDAGFDIVVPFNKVTDENVTKLVQDAIFSRKPKAPTTFFIGGSNVREGERIGKKVIKALVPPFECPVIIDPRGSHTTAAAVVAKTIEIATERGIPILIDKKVVVLGTGPVGRIASIIASKLQCKTYLVETWAGASDDSVKDLADELSKEIGTNSNKIQGVKAITEEEKFKILKDADVIWSLAAAGVQVVSKELMLKMPKNKILVDVNAVPPFGIEGIKPKDDKNEIYPGIYGIGSLAVGRLKYMIESKMLKMATQIKGKIVLDYNIAFQFAQELLFGKKIELDQKAATI